MIFKQQKKGFTFVEVLVALVIIAVGVAGLVSLQRMFLQSSTRATERTAAMEMAQEKIEELRFTQYASLAGGTDSDERAGKTFSLNWTVGSQYLVGSGWVPAGSPSEPDPLPPEPDAKAVTLTVSWVERAGDAASLTMEAWFNKIESRDGGMVVTQPGARAQPRVTYSPGAAPEVMALRLTDDANAEAYQVKETTKPVPLVEKFDGDKLQVTFNTVTYDEASKTQRIEDFVTVNCTCELVDEGNSGMTPARLTLQNGRLQLDPNGSQPEDKMVGRAIEKQPELCDMCCRDHHDSNEMVEAGTVYRTELGERLPSGDHRHFTNKNGVLVQAGRDDQYEESCRMRRVDGYYVTYPDWELEAVTIMNSDYLVEPATSNNYTKYVRDVVYNRVMGEGLPAEPAGRDDEYIPGLYQLIARGVYLDRMSPDHLAAVRAAIEDNRDDWLSLVPFYEVNLTLLGKWESSLPDVASVTSDEDIVTIDDPEGNYYEYSRGRLAAKTAGTTEVSFNVNSGNASILGSSYIHEDEQGELYTSEKNATVIATDDQDVSLYSVSGDIECEIRPNGNNQQYKPCKPNDFKGFSVSITDLNASCEFFDGKGQSKTEYTCKGIRAGSSPVISFHYEDEGARFEPSFIGEPLTNISESKQINIKMWID